MRIFIFVLMFFIIVALIIISNNNFSLIEKENFEKFSKIYYGWLVNIFSNMYDLTGYVVKINWLPSNGTFPN